MEYISIPQQMVCADTGLLCSHGSGKIQKRVIQHPLIVHMDINLASVSFANIIRSQHMIKMRMSKKDCLRFHAKFPAFVL